MGLTFGSLFAGIGGMDLGLERSGFTCRWQVELDPFARRVLEKHWPGVRRHGDVRTFPPSDPAEWSVDLIAGGFPCQPVATIAATSGKRKGIDDERWLWPEFRAVVARIRPRIVLIENVLGLISAGLGERVRDDLEADGYDTDPWAKIGACAVGAPHLRRRVFLVAHRDGSPLQRRRILADLASATRATARLPRRLHARVLQGPDDGRRAAIPHVRQFDGRERDEVAWSTDRHGSISNNGRGVMGLTYDQAAALGLGHLHPDASPAPHPAAAPEPAGPAARAAKNDRGQTKGEALFEAWLESLRVNGLIRWHEFEPVSLRLAGRTFYRPDFLVGRCDGSIAALEYKGGPWRDDAKVKTKVAAPRFPWLAFFVVLREAKAYQFYPVTARGVSRAPAAGAWLSGNVGGGGL